jgi:tRNA-2-methylthio-N6-dimethylallyladenosine synthase
MVAQLESRGMQRTENELDADLLIFNTCSIRDLAERKVMGKLGKLGCSTKRSQAVIGVTRCMANAKKDAIFQKLPHVDFVLGTNNIHELNTEF